MSTATDRQPPIGYTPPSQDFLGVVAPGAVIDALDVAEDSAESRETSFLAVVLGAAGALWGLARWPLAFTAILLFFALVYYLAPNAPQRDWRWITPGSLLGGLVWLAISGVFAL